MRGTNQGAARTLTSLSATLHPRLRPGCVVERGPAGWILRHRRARHPLPLSDRDHDSLVLLDGQRSVEDLALAWCRRYQTVSVAPFLALLAALGDAELLAAAETPVTADPASAAAPPSGSATWARVLAALGAPARPLLASPPVLGFLVVVLLGGAWVWLDLLARTPLCVLQLDGSYAAGVLALLLALAVLSLISAAAALTAHRAWGLPPGPVARGAWLGLPLTVSPPAAATALPPSRQAALLVTGPLVEGALSGLLAVLATQLPPGPAAAALLLAATAGYVRVFLACGPWGASALTRAVRHLTRLPSPNTAVRRLGFSRLWQALGTPERAAERRLALYGLGVLLWTALALYLLRLLAIRQVPLFLADVARPLPGLERAAANLLLLAGVVLLALGLVRMARMVVESLGRGLAAHRLWGRGATQVLLLLAVAVGLLLGLRGVSTQLPRLFPVVALGCAGAGAALSWAAWGLCWGLVRNGRLGLLALPLGLAALVNCLGLVVARRLDPAALAVLSVGVPCLVGLGAWGWIAYLWRSVAGYAGLALLTGAFLGSALPVPEAALAAWAALLVAALGPVVLCLAQVRGRLGGVWLLAALANLLPLFLRLVAPPEVAAGETTLLLATVGLFLAGALIVLYWGLRGAWRQPAVCPLEYPAELCHEPLGTLQTAYRNVAGPPAAARLRAEVMPTTPGDPLEQRVQALHRALVFLRQDLGSELPARWLQAGCEYLPWAEHLQLAGELGLAGWLAPPVSLTPARIADLMADSVVFAGLPPAQRERLARVADLRAWAPDERLVSLGAPAQRLFLVVDGHLALTGPEHTGAAPTWLLPGDTFGLEALLPEAEYPYTVVARDTARTVSWRRSDLTALALSPARIGELEQAVRAVRALREVSALQDQPEATLAAFLDRARREAFAPGEVVLRQGAAGDRFYLLTGGEVEVSQGEGAARQVLAALGPGEYFGELALLFDVPRTADVVARTAVETLSLSREDFLTLFAPVGRPGRALHHLALARVLQLPSA